MIPPTYNVKDDAGREAHDLRVFSDTGRDTLQNLLIELCQEYLDRKGDEDRYPFEMGLVLGVPFFDYAKKIESEVVLYSRIVLLAQIIGVDEITTKGDDYEETIKL